MSIAVRHCSIGAHFNKIESEKSPQGFDSLLLRLSNELAQWGLEANDAKLFADE
jgi:hypothetical protein